MTLLHSSPKRKVAMTTAKELAEHAGEYAVDKVETAKPRITEAMLEAREKGLPLVAAGTTYAADQALSAASRVKDRADDVAEAANSSAKEAAKARRRRGGKGKIALLLLGAAVSVGACVVGNKLARERQLAQPQSGMRRSDMPTRTTTDGAIDGSTSDVPPYA